MKTAQEYLDGLEKEASMLSFVGKGIKRYLGKGASKTFGRGASSIGDAAKSAKGYAVGKHKAYQGTNLYKDFGNNPLYAAGGLATGGIIL